MSSLISSFIIEPVVRQARRFSGVQQTTEPATIGHLHAFRPAQALDAADRDGAAHSGASTAENNGFGISESQSTISALRRYSVFIRRSRPASRPSALAHEERNLDEAATESAPLSLSDTRSTTPLPIDSVADSGMSQNPSRSIPEQFRTLDITTSSPTSSVANLETAGDEGRERAGSGGSGNNAPAMSEALPADDGMRHLRARIHEIQDLKVPTEEKARMMHYLMTERYNLLRPQSPSSIVSHDRPFTPSSAHSIIISDAQVSSPISVVSDVDPENPYKLRQGDTDPTFRTRSSKTHSDHNGEDDDFDTAEDGTSLGCQHYKRNVKVQCYQCQRWYTCRYCHDEVETHSLDRRKTQNMLCMDCGTPQPAGEHCRECGQQAAWYYCDICKLWDDNSSKKIYHCLDCGICRRGEGLGKDYIHCKRCNVCINIAFGDSHRCVERATDCNCPICGEYLFNSPAAVVSMPCGHYIHQECYNLYIETAYKCPTCKKSVVNMELQWRKLTQAIECQPMPEQFADTRAVIQCNDCSAKSSVNYHWLGNKCNTCDSYNTNEIRLLSGPESEQAADVILSTELPNEQQPTAIRSGLSPQRPMVEIRPARSYFLGVQDEHENRSRPSTAEPASLPYQMLERVSRSLSPLRNYLGRTGDDLPLRTVLDPDDDQSLDFWGADGRFLSGEEESEGSDSDSDESMEDEDAVEEDEGDDEGDDEMNDIELFGHR
ncbi:zf-CHY-domain-containing protein [Lepidopterella palustris CBS 459.81]|uniref:Zf-CHY-domain-containing protein n=1 Tax=Lepidopterella palustris CBS 459.81 TaxID=1314670 RepID=A0A8E2E6B4_9PEZI|nr:zf-CHY-domain-containing protein [Lepidopterella palustris CBS 459.81]